MTIAWMLNAAGLFATTIGALLLLLACHGGKATLGDHVAARPLIGFLQLLQAHGQILGAIESDGADVSVRRHYRNLRLSLRDRFGSAACFPAQRVESYPRGEHSP